MPLLVEMNLLLAFSFGLFSQSFQIWLILVESQSMCCEALLTPSIKSKFHNIASIYDNLFLITAIVGVIGDGL